MRIFTAIRHSKNSKRFYGDLWSANFYPALRELGHEIVESHTDLLPTSRFMCIAGGFTPEELEVRARTTQRILDEVRAAQRLGPVHLFLSYFYNAHFDPSGFDDLRRLGIPSVNFYCNSIYQFAHVRGIASEADFSWHAERDARALYHAVGANPVWVQMGADPNVYHPLADVTRQPKACFVGQRYADRDRWATALIRAGVPVDLYGYGWGGGNGATVKESEEDRGVYLGRAHMRPGSGRSYGRAVLEEVRSEGFGRGVKRIVQRWRHRSTTRRLTPLLRSAAKGSAHAIAQTFAGYEVIVNFSNVWSDGHPGSLLIPHVRLRDFEAPMCRSCYLTGHTDEIAEFYEIGKEIDTYSDKDEFVDKVRFYFSHRDVAEKLRAAGFERARRDHTWKCRFVKLFHETGLS